MPTTVQNFTASTRLVDADSDAVAGNIGLLGDNVGLFAGTKVSASGNSGGGSTSGGIC